MIEVQNTKSVQLLAPQIKNNGAFANNGYIDTQSFNHLRVLLDVGATDVAIGSGDASTAPLVEECDTTGGSYTAVSGAALSAVIGATDDNKLYAIDIDLTKSHKRYMRVKAPTAGNNVTGANLSILGILSRPDIGPANAAQQGLTEHIKA